MAGKWSIFVIKRDHDWATLRRNGAPTAFTLMSPSGHRLDCIALGQERQDVPEIETCYELGKGLQLSSQQDQVPVHVRLPPARRWRRGNDRLPTPDGTTPLCVGRGDMNCLLCETYGDSVEKALSTSRIVNSDLLLETEQHSSHLRKKRCCLHQILNLRNENLLSTPVRQCI